MSVVISKVTDEKKRKKSWKVEKSIMNKIKSIYSIVQNAVEIGKIINFKRVPTDFLKSVQNLYFKKVYMDPRIL